MTRGTIKTWWLVHKWTSLICTAFLLLLCITGLPLIFWHEIDELTGAHVDAREMPAGTPNLPLDVLVQKALARQPGHVPLYLSFDDEQPTAYVTTGPTPTAEADEMVFDQYDLRTGEVLPKQPEGGFMDIMFRLHVDMFMGLPGMLFLGFMGLLFFVAIVSGVVLYAPFMKKLDFGTVRRTRSTRVKWLDLHNLLGVVTVAWASVVGLTGTINTLSTPIVGYWRNTELAPLIGNSGGTAARYTPGAIQPAVDKVMRAAPDTRIQFIAFPGVPFSSDHHYAIFLQGNTPLTEKLLTPALVDARTGAATVITDTPWYIKTLLLSQPLHFGDYGGMPMKILWALLDIATIVVLGSGLYLWLGARRRPASDHVREVRAGAALNEAIPAE